MTSANTCPICSGALDDGICWSCNQPPKPDPEPYPYTATCLASRLPTDNICATCTIRKALERRDGIAGAPISAKPARCKKSDADWVAGKTCEPCDGCEVTP